MFLSPSPCVHRHVCVCVCMYNRLQDVLFILWMHVIVHPFLLYFLCLFRRAHVLCSDLYIIITRTASQHTVCCWVCTVCAKYVFMFHAVCQLHVVVSCVMFVLFVACRSTSHTVCCLRVLGYCIHVAIVKTLLLLLLKHCYCRKTTVHTCELHSFPTAVRRSWL